MKSLTKLLSLFVLVLAIPLAAQTVVAPQYVLNVNYFGSGIYGQTSALDNVFGYQLTTNVQLEGDLLAAPSGGISDYEAGANYDLCGIKAVENALLNTSLNCGKLQILAGVVAGEGRLALAGLPVQGAPAFMAKITASIPNASGSFAPVFAGGYGDFGPSVAGQSNKGMFFYSGFTFGGGNNEAATQAKQLRRQRADAKKQAKFMVNYCAANPKASGCQK